MTAEELMTKLTGAMVSTWKGQPVDIVRTALVDIAVDHVATKDPNFVLTGDSEEALTSREYKTHMKTDKRYLGEYEVAAASEFLHASVAVFQHGDGKPLYLVNIYQGGEVLSKPEEFILRSNAHCSASVHYSPLFFDDDDGPSSKAAHLFATQHRVKLVPLVMRLGEISIDMLALDVPRDGNCLPAAIHLIETVRAMRNNITQARLTPEEEYAIWGRSLYTAVRAVRQPIAKLKEQLLLLDDGPALTHVAIDDAGKPVVTEDNVLFKNLRVRHNFLEGVAEYKVEETCQLTGTIYELGTAATPTATEDAEATIYRIVEYFVLKYKDHAVNWGHEGEKQFQNAKLVPFTHKHTHTHIHTHTYTPTHPHTHTPTHPHVHAHTYTRTPTHAHTHIHV
jgi:hypothetical protein